MATSPAHPGSVSGEFSAGGAEARLERGEVICLHQAPFALPVGEELEFLLGQELGGMAHKNISYNPHTGEVNGHVRRDEPWDERLASLLGSFSGAVSGWLPGFLSLYRGGIEPDRVSYRPLEEATRRLRLTARNDLLHIDAFPNRPSGGRRLLRVFANINPNEPRVWVTSEPFGRLLERFRDEVPRLQQPGPGSGWLLALGAEVFALMRSRARLSAYDRFMLRLHTFLKTNEEFQERAPKKLWSFPSGCVWLAMTDGCTYGELRGRYTLEHSFFIRPEVLALPGQAPAALLEQAGAGQRRAA